MFPVPIATPKGNEELPEGIKAPLRNRLDSAFFWVRTATGETEAECTYAGLRPNVGQSRKAANIIVITAETVAWNGGGTTSVIRSLKRSD